MCGLNTIRITKKDLRTTYILLHWYILTPEKHDITAAEHMIHKNVGYGGELCASGSPKVRDTGFSLMNESSKGHPEGTTFG